MKQIVLLGTSHIAEESIRAIDAARVKYKPDLIAVELDTGRLDALLHHRKQAPFFQLIARVGVTGAVFALIGSYVQKKLGSKVGVLPGADMLAAVRLAHKNKLPVFLIDQPLEATLSHFSRAFTFREKLRLMGDLFLALFFPEQQIKKYGLAHLDLSRVPPQKLIARMVRKIKKHYPSLYQVLIAERNQHMVYQLVRLAHQYPDKNILAVVGAGHVEGMRLLLARVK